MEPITREEMYLASAAGEYSGELPEPKTRLEYYLKKIKEAVENGSSVAPEDIDAAIEAYLNSHDADIVTEQELSDALAGYYDKDAVDTTLNEKQDTLTAGDNISIETVNGELTISATDTTYSAATTSAPGLMSVADKTKLDNVESGAQVNVKPDWDAASGSDAEILNKPTIPSYSNATTSAAGLMSAADKSKLDAINIGQMVYIDESTANITLSSPRTLSESLSNYKIIEVRVLQFEEMVSNTFYQTWGWVRLIKSSAGTFSAVPVMHFIRNDGSLVMKGYEIGISSSNPNQLVLLRDTAGTGLWTNAIVGYK